MEKNKTNIMKLTQMNKNLWNSQIKWTEPILTNGPIQVLGPTLRLPKQALPWDNLVYNP